MVKKGVNKMAKVDIISGFLGAGKTTLIKKLLNESLKDEKLVLIENEFGEIGIDGGFMRDAGITVNELSQGCICCSLAGDFETALKGVVDTYHPDRIIIEPTGVGKLSDIIAAVQKVHGADLTLDRFFTVVDAKKCKMYHKNFGEFFNNQIGAASCVILSRSQDVSEEKIAECLDIIRELNPHAPVVTTPWDQITGDMILEASNHKDALEKALIAAEKEHQESVHGHHHEHHHHHDHDHDHEGGHHHEHEHEHDHEHEHEHEECGHHHHHHHHDHDHGETEEYGIGTWVYFRRKPFDLNKFDYFAARKWPENVIRTKGLVYFSSNRDMSYIFEQASVQKKLTEAGYWYASAPEEDLKMMLERDPQLRRDWDPEYGDRMIKLVFIGRDLDREALAKELDACLA